MGVWSTCQSVCLPRPAPAHCHPLPIPLDYPNAPNAERRQLCRPGDVAWELIATIRSAETERRLSRRALPQVGGVAANAIIAFFLQHAGWRAAFFCCAVMASAVGVANAALLVDHPKQLEWSLPEELQNGSAVHGVWFCMLCLMHVCCVFMCLCMLYVIS